MADQAEDAVVLAQQRTGADYALHSDTRHIIYWCHARFKMHCHSGRWHCAVTFKKSCGARGKKVVSLLAPRHEFNQVPDFFFFFLVPSDSNFHFIPSNSATLNHYILVIIVYLNILVIIIAMYYWYTIHLCNN